MDTSRHARSGAPFAGLTPDAVLEAAEALGSRAGWAPVRPQQLRESCLSASAASTAAPVVMKFYRAARWSDAANSRGARVRAGTAAQELPVAAPLTLRGTTLHHHGEFRLAVFPLCAGTAPGTRSPRTPANCSGRTLARIHAVGVAASLPVSPHTGALRCWAARARQALLRSPLLPRAHARAPTRRSARRWSNSIDDAFAAAAPLAADPAAWRLPSGQYPLAAARAAVRRSGRLHERPAHPGSVDVPVRAMPTSSAVSGARSWRAITSSACSSHSELQLVEALRATADAASCGLDRRALGGPRVSAGLPLGRSSPVIGRGTSAI